MSKKRILLLSDDLRLHSGIGTMSKEFVEGTLHKYDWIQLGGAVKHPEEGKIADISKEAQKTTGVKDAYLKIYPISGYGNSSVVRELIVREKIDGIMHFTDPRFWGWLYNMEHEIRQTIPIMYYNIWDDLPYPQWNENAYESCDALMAISKQTYNINTNVCQRKPRVEGKDLFYVQHGIDEKNFFPIDELDAGFVSLKQDVFIRRKGIQDLIMAYTRFMDELSDDERKKCTLILHTDPIDQAGTDLPAQVRALCPHQIIFSNQKLDTKHLNYLYNSFSVTCCPSSAEGFGLSHMESMMAGTPTISTVLGGLQDQQGWRKKNGEPVTLADFTTEIPSNSTGKMGIDHGPWTYPMFPQISLGGSPSTPYIYDSRPEVEDIYQGIKFWYKQGHEERKRCGSIGRDWGIENGFTAKGMCDAMEIGIDTCFETFKPRDRYTLIDTDNKQPKYPTGVLV